MAADGIGGVVADLVAEDGAVGGVSYAHLHFFTILTSFSSLP